MSEPASRLTPFQREVLEAFFERTHVFYLTGGAALAGFHLRHRSTHDLDLFTLEGPLSEGVDAVHDLAGALGARCEELRTAPEFRRFLLSRADDSVVVDLVLERTAQSVKQKPTVGSIRIDPPEEILANKLCALLGRAEIRDLVDVRALEQAGQSVERALAAAHEKDGGLTPAQLAWVLSQISIGDQARVPGEVTALELRRYLEGLVERLVVLARPDR